VGLVGHGDFQIGDTLSQKKEIIYNELPHFSPEVFATLINPDPSKYKQFQKALEHFTQEGTIQVFYLVHTSSRMPILGAVGPLQFEIVSGRLLLEYGIETKREPLTATLARWLPASFNLEQTKSLELGLGTKLAVDAEGHYCLLFDRSYHLDFFNEKNPDVKLLEISPVKFSLTKV
jgi:peptide chain release factor 3